VLIDAQGHVKLSDFGIARMAEDEFKTQEGVFRGTLPFSAPESLHGDAPDPRVDQYGCAVVLYFLLTGKNPFKGTDPRETMMRVLTYEPRVLAELRNDVPPRIAAAIARALSKDPAARFASVTEFAEALRAGTDWSERAVAERFKAQIAQDFSGDALSDMLGIESLAVRDASWRDAQDGTNSRVSLSSSPPGMESGRKGEGANAATTVRERLLPASSAPARPARIGLWIGMAALAAGAGSAAVLLLFSQNTAQAPAGLVVIEKQSVEPGAGPANDPAEVPAPSAAPPAAGTAPAPSAPQPVPVARAPKAADDRGAALARALQQREGKIQGCFKQHAPAGAETPKMSVRISIDAAGTVTNAVVSPGTVAGTPLGQCMLGIVKATPFGAQPEPVSFTIPIAARVVRP
jgi:hypothetical protein